MPVKVAVVQAPPVLLDRSTTISRMLQHICDGGALIVRPFGKVEAGPLNRDKTVLFCDIDPSAAPRSRRSLDVTGHYARPDIFHLQVNRAPLHDEQWTKA